MDQLLEQFFQRRLHLLAGVAIQPWKGGIMHFDGALLLIYCIILLGIGPSIAIPSWLKGRS